MWLMNLKFPSLYNTKLGSVIIKGIFGLFVVGNVILQTLPSETTITTDHDHELYQRSTGNNVGRVMTGTGSKNVENLENEKMKNREMEIIEENLPEIRNGSSYRDHITTACSSLDKILKVKQGKILIIKINY